MTTLTPEQTAAPTDPTEKYADGESHLAPWSVHRTADMPHGLANVICEDFDCIIATRLPERAALDIAASHNGTPVRHINPSTAAELIGSPHYAMMVNPEEKNAMLDIRAGTHVLVPVEPTEAMTWAGREARKAVRSGGVGGQTMEESYKYEHRFELAMFRAMITAAQEK